MTSLTVPAEIRQMIQRGALFVCNHSGGKDSQAMLLFLRKVVPAHQLLVVHATLGDVEWPGTIDHIRDDIDDLPLVIAQARKKDGSDRTFLNMVDDKSDRIGDVSPWPSPNQRQCTSDLKRGPIVREVLAYLKQRPEFGKMVVNCEGIRAGESAKRAKKSALTKSARNSKAGRVWLDWLPIFKLHTLEVLGIIADGGKTLHWCYQSGMSRMSCCLCIMSSEQDLHLGATLRPDLLVAYAVREITSGFTFRMPVKGLRRWLRDLRSTPQPAFADLADLI